MRSRSLSFSYVSLAPPIAAWAVLIFLLTACGDENFRSVGAPLADTGLQAGAVVTNGSSAAKGDEGDDTKGEDKGGDVPPVDDGKEESPEKCVKSGKHGMSLPRRR